MRLLGGWLGMKKVWLLVSIVLFALPAQSFASEELAPRIISVATGDIDRDGKPDAAMIIAPDDDAYDDNAVAVYLADSQEGTVSLKTYIPNFVWGSNGPMFGNRPSIAINASGSILVNSHNEAIGRNRWSQTLTLVVRDSRLLVAGYTYNSYDTLENDNYSACDLNVLTGNGTKNRGETATTISMPGKRIDAVDWLAATENDPCGLFE